MSVWKSRLKPPPSVLARWRRYWPFPLVTALVLAVTPWLVGDPVPREIVIASGQRDGAYFAFATEYAETLRGDGIRVTVLSSAGSIENSELLHSGKAALAIVQAGAAVERDREHLQSLASIYLEPVWVFHKADLQCNELTDLAAKRIAVGPEGSGTRALALRLLEANGLDAGESAVRTTTAAGGSQAAQALRRGEVDAAIFVISPESPVIRQLLTDSKIKLMSFDRAEAYTRRMTYLSQVTLPEGALDLEHNLPGEDVELLATTANLVTRDDLHSALIPPILEAAFAIHGGTSMFHGGAGFPSPENVELPLAADARSYFRSGPSFLFRYLPFRLASWIDRMKLLLLPLVTVLFPLFKAAPPLYRWRIRSRIYRWYVILREIDKRFNQADGDADFSADIEKLQVLEEELSQFSIPLSYMEEFYNLRLHIGYVLEKLRQREVDKATAQ